MILIIPNHEHGMFFHLFVSSLNSFSSGLLFSLKRSFTSHVSCISRYFIFFVAMGMGVHSGFAYLYYWYIRMVVTFAHWFCVLRLCWSCLSAQGVLGLRRWGFLNIQSCHLQTDNFTSSLPIWIPFISFSCLMDGHGQNFQYCVEWEWWERASLSCAGFQRECF